MSADERIESDAGTAPSAAADGTALQSEAATANAPASDDAEPAMAFLAVLILVAFTLMVFRHVGENSFVYDDQVNILQNPYLAWDQVGQFWREPYAQLYIPVTYTVWTAQSGLSQFVDPTAPALDPRVFHYVNLGLHFVAVLLVYFWLRTLVDSSVGPLAGALLFAVHPLQAETVNWVTETKGTLSTVFGLAALLLFSRFLADASARRWAMYLLATIALALALLSKPTMAAIPLVAGVIEVSWNRRSMARVAAPLALWVALVGVTIWLSTGEQTAGSIRNIVGWPWRPLVAGDAIAFYLGKLVWPFGLALDYSRYPAWLVRQPAVWLMWLMPVVLAGVLCLSSQRRPLLIALAVFVAALAPTLGLIPFGFQEFSTVADRYAYLAMLGPALALAWVCSRWPKNGVYVAVGVFLLFCGWMSNMMTTVWQNQATVFQHTLRVNPGSVVGNMAIGNLLVGEDKLPEAIEAFRVGLKTDPGSPGLLGNLGCALEGAGEVDEAAKVLAAALEAAPENPLAHVGKARLLIRQGDIDGAIKEFVTALEYKPEFVDARAQLAQALSERGRTREAVENYREVVRARPTMWLPIAQLSWLLATSEDRTARNGSEAVELAERAKSLAVAQAPQAGLERNPMLRVALGAAYAEAGRQEMAAAILELLASDLGQVAKGDPRWSDFHAVVVQLLERVKAGEPIQAAPLHKLGVPTT